MSKKKNTLKDLDDFLKQQAAMLVAPEKLSGKSEEPTTVHQPVTPEREITVNIILDNLKALSRSETSTFREHLYHIIIQTLEAQSHSTPEDKILINTALYLKSGDNWKDAIRAYWKNR
ncbi:MAG: hypothetical protein JNM57_08950 [Cyclobacteriaceae bacterium]|nr:hypothetical protein [Cyclobacteriaceae bacterium]